MFRIKIIYRVEKTYSNANELSKLLIFDAKTYYAKIYFTIILSANENFQKFFREFLFKNSYFDKIYEKIKKQIKKTKNNENETQTIYQLYRLNIEFELFYFVNKFDSNKVCILIFLQKNLFKFAYNNYTYERINKFLNRFRRSIYLLKIKNRLKKYIDSYLIYQLSKFSRQLLYKQLHSIEIFKKSLAKLSINFIIELLIISNKYNALIIVTCRFSKYIRLILKKKT